MRVLQIGKYYYPAVGGMESVVRDLAEGLNSRKFETDVLCSGDSMVHQDSIIDGVNVSRCSSWGVVAGTAMSPDMIRRLRKRIDSYDIVHVHHPNPMATLALLLARPRCKVVLHWHSDIVKQKVLLRAYGPLLEWQLRRADAIVATSPNYAETSPYLLANKRKTSVVPIGINTQRLRLDRELLDELKARFRGKKIIFSLGRMTYYKGFRYLIEAMRYLPENVIVLLGGSGELKDGLTSLSRGLGVMDRVVFLGHIHDDDLAAYYGLCDVFCLPSIARSEAFGVVLLEAMVHSKPMVTTSIRGSGMSWINVDGLTGLVVAPENSMELGSALGKLLNDPAFADRCGENAHARFDRMFTSDTMVEGIVRVYDEVMN